MNVVGRGGASASRVGVLVLVLLGSVWGAVQISAQGPTQPIPAPAVAPMVVASPNPASAGSGLGSTTLTWTTGDGSDGLVYVSRDGETEALFARGPTGSSVANWIADGSAYQFRLYAEGRRATSLASIEVTRRDTGLLEPVLTSVALTFLLAALVILARRWGRSFWSAKHGRDTRLALEQLSRNGRDGGLAWRFEVGVAAAIALCLWAKLIYAAHLTASKPWGDRIVGSASLATVLLLISGPLLLPRVWQLVALLLINVAVSGVLLADELYFRQYIDIITIPDLASAPLLVESFVRPVIVQLLRPIDLVYVLDLAVLVLALPFYFRATRGQAGVRARVRWRVAACTLVIGALAAVPMARVLWGQGYAAGNSAYRGEIVGTLGILPYHFYEAITWLSAPPEPKPDLHRIREFLARRRQTAPPSNLFGIAKRKNLILIQAESLQEFPIGLRVNGQAVAPNLAAFARESLHFVNFFDQTHHGFTSDGEFTALSSLHPLPEGAASVTHRTNHYRSLPAILDAHGYATLSACAADGRVWSMAMMHPNHGFELSLFEDRFEDGERFQLLSDGEFFSQMLPRLTNQPHPFMAFLITSSNHGPFDIPERHRTLRLPDELTGSSVGDYLQSVHYFDRVLGAFLDELRSAGLLDESVVAIYGDHAAHLSHLFGEIADLAGLPDDSKFHQWLVGTRLPLLIRLPHGERAGPLDTPAGHLDIAPTLLGLLGVTDDERVMFGRDATSHAPPFVVFRDGGFADGEHYYTMPHTLAGNPVCYQARTGRRLNCRRIEPGHTLAREQLAVSDWVLRHDLIPALVSAPIPTTVADLPSPRPYSTEYGVDHVTTSGFDVWAPTPSGATFGIDNGGEPVRVLFSPIATGEVRAAQTDGVIFEVWSGPAQLYRQRVLPGQLEAAAVDVPPVRGSDRIEVSLVTRSATEGVPGPHRATWQSVRFLKGSDEPTNSANRPKDGWQATGGKVAPAASGRRIGGG